MLLFICAQILPETFSKRLRCMHAHTIRILYPLVRCFRARSAQHAPVPGTHPRTFPLSVCRSFQWHTVHACSSSIGMELQLSLLRAVAVGLIALQCSIFSVVYGLPARGGTATERDGDDNGYEEYYYYEEDDVAADTVRIVCTL